MAGRVQGKYEGEVIPCPRLIWILPHSGLREAQGRGMERLFTWNSRTRF